MTSRAPYQGTDAWREERRSGYGASDAPILVEGDELAWKQLHGVKLGILPEREASETMELGKRLEHLILRMAAERSGEPIVRVNRILRHPELPYVFASLDGRRKRGDRRPVEAKKWAFKGDEWGPAGTDIVPTKILYQVQQQIAVVGADAVDVWVLFAGAKLEQFTVGRDEGVIHELLSLETAAWAFVARGEIPPWPGQAPRRITLAADEIAVDETLLNLVEIEQDAERRSTAAEQELEDAKDRIRALLADVGGAKGVMPDGRRLSISHRPQDPAQRVVWEQVAAAYRKALENVLAASSALRTPRQLRPALDQAQAAIASAERALTVTAAGKRPLRITVGKETPRAA